MDKDNPTTLNALTIQTEGGRSLVGLHVREHPWLYWDPKTKHAYCERCGTVTEITRGLVRTEGVPFGVLIRPNVFVKAWSRFVEQHAGCPAQQRTDK